MGDFFFLTLEINIVPELSILKYLLDYSNWEKYNNKITTKDFPEELQELYRTLDVYHKEQNESQSNLALLDLSALFFSQQRKDKAYYEGVFKTLEGYTPNETAVTELIKSLRKQNILRSISLAAYAEAEGKQSKESVDKLFDQLRSLDEKKDEDEIVFVTDDLAELKESTVAAAGLRWRLSWLNRALGSLRRGDFGFIFARPETGKTTFLASEVSFMAEQLKETDGPILWINNEEQGSKVKVRCYQASLGLSTTDLFGNIAGNDKEFKSRTKGKIKIYDSANITKRFVEQLCKTLKPSLIVFDQIDKIQGFDNDREDLRLGAIYIWARELAKCYCPVIGICQANGTAENVRYLTMAHVANSATAKQAEADFILGIGCINDTGWDKIRFLSISKNKLLGDGPDITDPELRHGRGEVIIEPNIGRYKDIQ